MIHYLCLEEIMIFFSFSLRMTIYDCDDYTQAYYKKDCNVNVERNLLHEKTKPENLLVKPPPHTITSVGKEEDSIQNCLHLQPKAPKRNLKKLLDFAGKVCNLSALTAILCFDWMSAAGHSNLLGILQKLFGKAKLRGL